MNNIPKILGGERAIARPLPHWPQPGKEEEHLLKSVVQSGEWWKLSGTQVRQFEREFAQYHNVPFGLLVTNGTHAIELALRCLGVGAGDEVIVPALTFIATASPVLKLGARPILVDVRSDDWSMDPEALESAITNKTKAIIPVHFAGQIARMERIMQIAKRYDICVLEDAAHAHGGKYMDRMAGSFGDMAIFSFQNFKLMTAGEGGFLMFNNETLYRKARLIANCGRNEDDRNYNHVILGDNFRVSEFQAAVLRAQLPRLAELGDRREKNAEIAIQKLKSIPGITVQARTTGTNRHSYYMLVFEYDEKEFNGLPREHFVQALIKEGIPAYKMYPMIQDIPFFKDTMSNRDSAYVVAECPVGRRLAQRGVWIHHRALLGNREQTIQMISGIRKIQEYSARIVFELKEVEDLVI